MRRIVPGLLLLLIACGSPGKMLKAQALVEDPMQYDGQAIVLVGTVENPRVEATLQGPGYTAFTLTDGTARVPVIAWNTRPVSRGDVVEVRGTFRSDLHAGSDRLSDTVEAKLVQVVRTAGQSGAPVGMP